MKEMSLEEGFEKLKKIADQMENDELSLEKMYSLYKEGIDIAKKCNEKIDTVEKNIKLITEDGEWKEFQ